VSKEVQHRGIGKVLTQLLASVGDKWDMRKIMLTVLKGTQPLSDFINRRGNNYQFTKEIHLTMNLQIHGGPHIS